MRGGALVQRCSARGVMLRVHFYMIMYSTTRRCAKNAITSKCRRGGRTGAAAVPGTGRQRQTLMHCTVHLPLPGVPPAFYLATCRGPILPVQCMML